MGEVDHGMACDIKASTGRSGEDDEDDYIPPDDEDDEEYIPSRFYSAPRRKKAFARKGEKPYHRTADSGKRVRFLTPESDGSSEQSVVTSSSSSSNKDSFIASLRIEKTSRGYPKCPLCDHVQMNKRMPDLRRHMRTHNPEEKKYPCPVCDTELSRKDAFRRHCILKHKRYYDLPESDT